MKNLITGIFLIIFFILLITLIINKIYIRNSKEKFYKAKTVFDKKEKELFCRNERDCVNWISVIFFIVLLIIVILFAKIIVYDILVKKYIKNIDFNKISNYLKTPKMEKQENFDVDSLFGSNFV